MKFLLFLLLGLVVAAQIVWLVRSRSGDEVESTEVESSPTAEFQAAPTKSATPPDFSSADFPKPSFTPVDTASGVPDMEGIRQLSAEEKAALEADIAEMSKPMTGEQIEKAYAEANAAVRYLSPEELAELQTFVDEQTRAGGGSPEK